MKAFPAAGRNGAEDCAALERCVRIWPHRMQGEGHFLALFRKTASCLEKEEKRSGRKEREKNRTAGRMDAEQKRLLEAFLEEGKAELPPGRVECRGERAYLVPELPEDLRGIHFLRCGLFLGEFQKGKIRAVSAVCHGPERQGVLPPDLLDA